MMPLVRPRAVPPFIPRYHLDPRQPLPSSQIPITPAAGRYPSSTRTRTHTAQRGRFRRDCRIEPLILPHFDTLDGTPADIVWQRVGEEQVGENGTETPCEGSVRQGAEERGDVRVVHERRTPADREEQVWNEVRWSEGEQCGGRQEEEEDGGARYG
jgi:hypothetical protein